MNELQIFNNPDFGDIRALEIDGEAWFVGRDVATALGYSNQRNAIARHVDEDDALKRGVTDNLGREQQTILINESGVLALILMSELPSAKKFKRWVTKEVLPLIMKTGSYNLPQLSQNELILQIAQSNVEYERRIASLENTQEDIKHTQHKIEQRIETAIGVFTTPNADHWKADIDNAINYMVETYKRSPTGFRGMLYKELEEAAGVCLHSRVSRLQGRLKKQGATYKQRQAVSKMDTISADKQLRKIFEGIIKKYQALYGMSEGTIEANGN